MGQKINPTLHRLGINEHSRSVWYAKKNYADLLFQDLKAREYITEKMAAASVSRVQIERTANAAKITVHCARPGVIIGRKGGGVADVTAEVTKMMKVPVHMKVAEVRGDLCATIGADNVAKQLERRVMFRRAMKRVVQSAMRAGALGVKIMVSGRLGGAEIARTEWYREGRVPLHTFRAKVDYGTARANTTYGVIGVKVWIFKGEEMETDKDQTIVVGDEQETK